MSDEPLALRHSIQLEKLIKEIKSLRKELDTIKDKIRELDRRTAGSKIIGGATL